MITKNDAQKIIESKHLKRINNGCVPFMIFTFLVLLCTIASIFGVTPDKIYNNFPFIESFILISISLIYIMWAISAAYLCFFSICFILEVLKKGYKKDNNK
jgi:predicted membrane protein